MSQNHSLSLFSLPLEMLEMIVGFLLPDLREPVGVGINFILCPDLLALLSTCRTLRAITIESQFWRNEYVNLVRINPKPAQFIIDHPFHPFLDVLLEDPHFLVRLSQRRAWHFESVTMLQRIIRTIPSFNPTSIFLSFEHDLTREVIATEDLANDALLELHNFHHLTSLELNTLPEDVVLNLSIIYYVYPLLESLRLIDVEACSGSLRPLPKLKTLVLHDVVADHRLFVPVDGEVPTLRHLSLIDPTLHGGHWEYALDGALFNPFTHLTSFFLWPLSNEICEALAKSTLRLTELRTTATADMGNGLEDDHESASRAVLKLLSSDSCSSLRRLTLILEFGDKDYCDSVVSIITTSLDKLEDLTLGMGLNTEWFPKFASLPRLKKIVWYVHEDLWWGPEVPGHPRPSVTVLTGLALDEFQKVLDRFDERPSVRIWVEPGGSYTRLCNCEDIPFIYNDGLYGPPLSTPYSYNHMAEGAFSECFCDDCVESEEMEDN